MQRRLKMPESSSEEAQSAPHRLPYPIARPAEFLKQNNRVSQAL
jgi:hypothetical protein